jgi:hypothetical protein
MYVRSARAARPSATHRPALVIREKYTMIAGTSVPLYFTDAMPSEQPVDDAIGLTDLDLQTQTPVDDEESPQDQAF